MQRLRKIFATSVMAMTVLSMSGVNAFAATYTPVAGDLIKVTGVKTVYVIGNDGQRYTFLDEPTFKSWYPNFVNTKTISTTDMNNIVLSGKKIAVRPGTWMVRTQTNPRCYIIANGNVMRYIDSEAAAANMFAADWKTKVNKVNNLDGYTVGTTLGNTEFPAGAVVQKGTDYYSFDGTSYRKFSDAAALTANNYDLRFVMITSQTINATGTPITGYEAALGNITASAITNTVNLGTGLTVALASDTPASASIVTDGTYGGQAQIPFTKFNFTAAADGDMTITTLKFKRTGISSDADLNNVYLYDGATRLAEMTSISAGVITFTASGGLFTVTKGTTKTITVKGDLLASTSSGKQIGIGITAASDVIVTSGAVSGSFPLNGNIMSSTAVTDLGLLTVANVSPSAIGTVNPQDGYEVWKFSLNAANQNLKVYSIAVTDIGSVAVNDLTNFKLYDGGTLLSTVASEDANKRIVFDLTSTPLSITSGVTKTLSVKADIKGGSNRTLRFSIQKSSDLSVMDAQYGVTLFPKPSGGTVGTWTVVQAGGATTVNPGTVTVTKSSTSPSGNIADNATNVKFGVWEMKAAGENVKVNSIAFYVQESGTSSTTHILKNVKVLFGDVQVGATKTSVTADDNGSQTGTVYTYTFGNSFIIPAGTTVLVSVYGDTTDTTVVAGDAYKFHMKLGAANAQGVTSLSSVNVPGSETDSNAVAVASASLTGAKNSAIASMNVVKGASNQTVGSVILYAGAAEGIDLSSVTLTDNTGGTTVDTGLGNALANVKLYQGTTQLGATYSNPGTTGSDTITFYLSPALSIAAGSSVQIDIKADMLSSGSTSPVIKVTTATTGIGKTTATSTALASAVSLQTVTAQTAGIITVAVDSDNPVSANLVMSSTNNVLGIWKLSANAYENLTVNQLIFVDNSLDTNSTNNVINLKLYDGTLPVGNTVYAMTNLTNTTNTFQANAASVTTAKLGADASDVNSYYNGYYIVFTSGTDAGKVGRITGYVGSTLVATFAPVGAAFTNEDHGSGTYKIVSGAVFTGINTTITAGGYKKLTLKGDSTDANNATAGLKSRFTLNTLAANPTGAATDTVIITGSSSGVYGTLATASTAYTANNNYTFRTKPTVAFLGLGGGSSTLTDGTHELMEFSVTADAGYDVTLYGIDTNIILSDNATATDLELNNIRMYRKTAPGTTLNDYVQINDAAGAAIADNSNALGTGDTTASVNANVQLYKNGTYMDIVPAGTTVTYVVEGIVANSAQYDSVLVRLADDAGATYASNGWQVVTSTPEDDNFAITWRDGSVSATIGSINVTTLPTATVSLTR